MVAEINKIIESIQSEPFDWLNWKDIQDLHAAGVEYKVEKEIYFNLSKMLKLKEHKDELEAQKPKGKICNPFLELAEIMMKNTPFKASNVLYGWNGSHYNRLEHDLYYSVQRLCSLYGFRYTQSQADEVRRSLTNTFHLKNDGVDVFNNDTIHIPFKNGYFNTKTKTLDKPSSVLCFTHCFEFNYNPSAECPNFKKYLNNTLLPDAQTKVLAFLAYSMTTSLSLQKAQLWHGSGSNGKTVLFDLISYLWKGQVVSLPLQEIEERFQIICFRDHLINFYPDLPKTRLTEDGKFKTAVTDSYLSCDEKFAGRANWRNITKHIYGCNEIPLPPRNATDAFFRRWIIIEFPYIFKNQADPDFNPNLHKPAMNIDELNRSLQDEAEGIIAYILTYLDKMDVLKITNIEDIKNQWYLHSENSMQFIQECDMTDLNAKTPCNDLYTAYREWCMKKNISVQTPKRFGMNIQDWGISCQAFYENGQRYYGYLGIKVKQDPVKAEPVKQEVIDENKLNRKLCAQSLKFHFDHDGGITWSDIIENQREAPERWPLIAPILKDFLLELEKLQCIHATLLTNDVKYEAGTRDFPKELLK